MNDLVDTPTRKKAYSTRAWEPMNELAGALNEKSDQLVA